MHPRIEELRGAARAIADQIAVVRAPEPGERCPCGQPAVIVFETRDRTLPYCGACEPG